MRTTYAVILGFTLGISLRSVITKQQWKDVIGYPGELFINALSLIVIPMISCGMVLATLKLGDIRKIKNIGQKALVYYLCTTFISCTEGLIWVNIFRPGVGNKEKVAALTPQALGISPTCYIGNYTVTTLDSACYPKLPQKTEVDSILDLGRNLIPNNIVNAYMKGNILGIIFFFSLFAFYAAKQKKCHVVKDFFEVCNDAFMCIVMGIIWWTPLGVFSLIAKEILQVKDLQFLVTSLALYVGTSVFAIFFHLAFVYPMIFFIVTRKNPYSLLLRMIDPMLTAFSTASSAATLPVTISTAEKNGVHKDISRFILPLGATINMDGTAVAYPITVIFLSNYLNSPLSAGKQVTCALISAFVSIGAAPIPSAGLVYLVLILDAVGVNAGGAISFVLAVDWFLDRCQTACNVTGDGFGANILEYMLAKTRREELSTKISDDEGKHNVIEEH